MICESENLLIDDDAIELIVEESEGTIRDSQNLLERVRFLGSRVTKSLVLGLLGKISEDSLIHILDLALQKQPQKLLLYLISISFNKLSPETLWDSLIDLFRTLVWIKYGIKDIPLSFRSNLEKLEDIARGCSINRINAILQLFWNQEELFSKSSKKHAFLEMVLLQITNQVNVLDLDDLLKNYKNSKSSNDDEDPQDALPKKNIAASAYLELSDSNEDFIENVEEVALPNDENLDEDLVKWNKFLTRISELKNLMLDSIFKQIKFLAVDKEKSVVRVSLRNKNKFFEDALLEFNSKISESLKEVFEGISELEFINAEPLQLKDTPINPSPASNDRQNKPSFSKEARAEQPKSMGFNKSLKENSFNKISKTKEIIDVSDAQKWPQAHLLTKYFSGRIETSSEN
jgi:DNA polymerase-3 subunit gamma/tau